MNERAKPRSGFGEAIGTMQDALLDPGRDIPLARQKFMRQRRRPRTARRSAWVVAAAAAVVVVVTLLIVLWPKPPLTFQVEGVEAQAEVGVPIAAPAPHDAVLRFSDGSTFVLRPHARARTTSLRAEGASILLERGAGIASVVPGRAKRWEFRAGEFRVLVTGTKFDLAWRPEDKKLSVRMHEGSIVVTGCQLKEGVGVSAGQALEVSCVQDQPEVSLRPLAKIASIPKAEREERPIEADAGGQPSGQPDAGEDVTEIALEPETQPKPSGMWNGASQDASVEAPEEVDAEPPSPSWQGLAASGQYRAAYEAAVSLGFGTQCNEAGDDDLLVLADAAMYAGQANHAVMALTAARRRFPSANAATTAAFMLGRIAFDHRHDSAEARRWFRVYLAERPSGSFAREAMGRLIEVEHRAGNDEVARALARRYLRKHPNGPHARLARSLLPDGWNDASQ